MAGGKVIETDRQALGWNTVLRPHHRSPSRAKEPPDGKIVPPDGSLDPYFREVSVDPESIAIFSKLVTELSADTVDD